MRRFVVSALGLLALTGPAVAVQTVTVGRADGICYRPGWGGEYQLAMQGDPVPGLALENPFQSLRARSGTGIEFVPAKTYGGTLYDRVVRGGGALTPEATYLYHSFVGGTPVTDYDDAPGLGRQTPARVLQAAMLSVQGGSESLLDILSADPQWYPVNNRSLEYAWANAFVAEAEDPGWNAVGDVRVLSLSSLADDEPPADDQDMLVLLVPAPGAVALGAAGLGILGWFRRRPGFRSAG